jgi:hypothetical protein
MQRLEKSSSAVLLD